MLSSRALFLVISLLRPVQSALLPRGSAAVYLTTRYWDCCKPSCSWPNFAPVTNPVTTCNIDDEPYSVEDGENAESSCLNGDTSGAFQCSSQQPWAVSDTLAYGFVAVSGSINESDTCCQCYSLTFTSAPIIGQQMIVQATNIGYDVNAEQFDIAIPGGGVGAFPEGCEAQYNAGPNGWGDNRYGGVSSESQCSELPTKLQPGCDFRFNCMKGVDNPSATYEVVACPTELTDKTNCVRTDGVQSSSTTTTTTTTSSTTTSSGGTKTSSSCAPTQTAYGQCGGQSWTCPTSCPSGYTRQVQNQYYSQCLPPSRSSGGGGGGTTTTSSCAPTQTAYGQCGGQSWDCADVCPSGYTCQEQNEYYSQCLPPSS